MAKRKKSTENKEITPEFLESIRSNQRVRQMLAHLHPLWFSLLYLTEHFNQPVAPFQLEMFHIIGEPKYRLVGVMAFRGSGKSTILNLANVLWSVLGAPERKFVIIISKTQDQAKMLFSCIKDELLHNKLLRKDFGPFSESERDWRKLSLELEYQGAKIISVSLEHSIRGMKHGRYRPDLIICDDLEDAVADEGGIYSYFINEIVPLGNEKTRIFILGNDMGEESFLNLMKNDIAKGESEEKIFREYPNYDKKGKQLWSAQTYIPTFQKHPYDKTEFKIVLRHTKKNARRKKRVIEGLDNLEQHQEQVPLIKQMKPYHIILFPDTEPITEGDPRYPKYVAYWKELKEIQKLETEIIRGEYHRQIDLGWVGAGKFEPFALSFN